MYYISTVPWLHYTQVIQPTGGSEDSNPRFVWGKFEEKDGRVTMPLSVLAHHALVDGLHIARFYEAFNKQMETYGLSFEMRLNGSLEALYDDSDSSPDITQNTPIQGENEVISND